MKVLTDTELRSRLIGAGGEVAVEEGTVITPAAADYIREKGLRLITGQKHPSVTITVNKTETTGEKPEDMTHLDSRTLVSKKHPGIAFRGKLDTFMAETLVVQVTGTREGYSGVSEDLGEILSLCRRIMAAEVRGTDLGELKLLGMDSGKLRYVTHHLKQEMGIDHPVPSADQGMMCVWLNRLRTYARELELSAVNADCRKDTIEALNRLSSCIYIIFCRVMTGYYRVEK